MKNPFRDGRYIHHGSLVYILRCRCCAEIFETTILTVDNSFEHRSEHTAAPFRLPREFRQRLGTQTNLDLRWQRDLDSSEAGIPSTGFATQSHFVTKPTENSARSLSTNPLSLVPPATHRRCNSSGKIWIRGSWSSCCRASTTTVAAG